MAPEGPLDRLGKLVDGLRALAVDALDQVVLAPARRAYAGLLLRQSNKDVSTLVKNMALAPHGQSPDNNTGEGVLLEMPKGGVYVDDKACVTYWNSSSEAAVSPLFAH